MNIKKIKLYIVEGSYLFNFNVHFLVTVISVIFQSAYKVSLLYIPLLKGRTIRQKLYHYHDKAVYRVSNMSHRTIFARTSNILKTKSNFTVFIIEYFYSYIDLIKIKYFSQVPRLVRTDFRKDSSCK